MALLEFKDIVKYYGEGPDAVLALDHVNLSVEEGEFVSIVGPSGCGKSTLLYIAGGFESHSGGEMLLNGKPILGPGRDRGMVFQDYSLFPWLTVRENVHFYFTIQTNFDYNASESQAVSRIEYADYLLEIMGLSDFADRRPGELSGGMKQRVAIARTLAPRPKVILMDEPFSALDAQTREEMQELLCMLKKHEKMTVLFITHDVDEAVYLSDRVVALSKRPGHVLDTMKIDLPGRPDLAIKESPEFLDMRKHFIRLIRSQAARTFDRDILERRLNGARETVSL
jgi:NitT/TauT family transport system ATP-binding protein